MTLDNMTGITEGSYTGFCKSQLITCNRVNECNGVCPFEDALKHADKMQTMNVQLADKSPEIGYTHGQMADRPKGEWIFNPTDAIDLMFAKPKCSKCGFESSDGGNYCSNCGAKMRGEEE